MGAAGGFLEIASAIGGVGLEIAGNSARQRALKMRVQQERAQAQQREIKRVENLNKVMARQNAVAGARGDLGSQTFQMVQLDTLNEFAKDESASRLNNIFRQENINQASINSNLQTGAGILNRAVNLGDSLYNQQVPGEPLLSVGDHWNMSDLPRGTFRTRKVPSGEI